MKMQKKYCGKNSKDAKKFRGLVSYALYGQIIIFIGFIMILMVVLLGSYNGRISLY